MTVHNPEHGEIFYDNSRAARVRYIGRDKADRLVMEDVDEEKLASYLFAITPDYARKNLVTWTEESVKLEPEQVWTRTRNDYADRAAVILAMVDFHDTLHVVYEEINGHGANPKLKREIDFRRVYGRLAQNTEDDS